MSRRLVQVDGQGQRPPAMPAGRQPANAHLRPGSSCQHRDDAARAACPLAVPGLLVACLVWIPPSVLFAEGVDWGAQIYIPSRVTTEATRRIETQTNWAIEKRQVRVLVYVFDRSEPQQDLGACLDLAEAIKKIQGRAATIAYVRGHVRSHLVLPILACQYIYMHEQAVLGEVLPPGEPEPDQATLERYRQQADLFGRPVALVLKMLLPSQPLFRLDTTQGKRYALQKDLRPEDQHLKPQLVKAAGEAGRFTAAEAVDSGLANGVLDGLGRLAELFGIRLYEATWGDEPLRPALVEIRGKITRREVESWRRHIAKALSRNRNLIFLQIESSEGDVDEAEVFARYLIDLGRGQDPAYPNRRVAIVAYIPNRVANAGVMIALGCQEMVVASRTDFGDCSGLVYRRGNRKQDEINPDLDGIRERFVALAQEQGYPTAVVRALLDPDMGLVRVEELPHADGDGKQHAAPRPLANPKKIVPLDEVEKNRARYRELARIKEPGKLLRITGKEAVDWGLARYLVDKREGLAELYCVAPTDLLVVGYDWIDRLVEFLTMPATTAFLVILAFTTLILEIKIPGVGVPGIVSAVCFVLLFWSYSWLSGEVNALAILLFLLGLALLGLELFVLPGFGVAGLGGVALMLTALSLLVVQRWPQTPEEYSDMGKNIALFAAAMVVALVLAYLVARYLPSVPYASKLLLPPPEEEQPGEAVLSSYGPRADLLGAVGVAVTELRPAGKARFGNDFLDVVAEGDFVEPGTRVQVVEIDGLRIVVKAV